MENTRIPKNSEKALKLRMKAFRTKAERISGKIPQKQYEVQQIMAHRKKGKSLPVKSNSIPFDEQGQNDLQFLIKWRGYEETTWEPRENLKNAPGIVQSYKQFCIEQLKMESEEKSANSKAGKKSKGKTGKTTQTALKRDQRSPQDQYLDSSRLGPKKRGRKFDYLKVFPPPKRTVKLQEGKESGMAIIDKDEHEKIWNLVNSSEGVPNEVHQIKYKGSSEQKEGGPCHLNEERIFEVEGLQQVSNFWKQFQINIQKNQHSLPDDYCRPNESQGIFQDVSDHSNQKNMQLPKDVKEKLLDEAHVIQQKLIKPNEEEKDSRDLSYGRRKRCRQASPLLIEESAIRKKKKKNEKVKISKIGTTRRKMKQRIEISLISSSQSANQEMGSDKIDKIVQGLKNVKQSSGEIQSQKFPLPNKSQEIIRNIDIQLNFPKEDDDQTKKLSRQINQKATQTHNIDRLYQLNDFDQICLRCQRIGSQKKLQSPFYFNLLRTKIIDLNQLFIEHQMAYLLGPLNPHNYQPLGQQKISMRKMVDISGNQSLCKLIFVKIIPQPIWEKLIPTYKLRKLVKIDELWVGIMQKNIQSHEDSQEDHYRFILAESFASQRRREFINFFD